MEMTSLNVRLPKALNERVVDEAGKSYGGNKSKVAIAALDAFLGEKDTQRENIPQEFKNRLAFIVQIMLNGNAERDWSFVEKEVLELWQCLN